MPNCLICGKFCKLLNVHITRFHKMPTSEYKSLYGADTPFTEQSVKDKQIQNGYSPMSIPGVMKKFKCDEAEAIQRINEHKRRTFTSETSIWSVKYWLKKGFSESEAAERVKFYQTYDEASYIRRYGEIEGRKKYQENNQKAAYSRQTEGMLKNGWALEEIKEQKDNFSIPVLMKKYGISETEAVGLRKSRLRNHNSYFCLDFWIKKGYQEEQSKAVISKLQSRQEDYWIKKYGEELGRQKYESYLSKLKFKFFVPSKESLQFFAPVMKFCDDNRIEYTLEKNVKVNGRSYHVDLVIEEYDLMFEFDGAKFHADPRIVDEQWKHCRSHATYHEILCYDNRKTQDLSSTGDTVIRIHSNYKHEFDLIKILKEKINAGNK